MTDVDWSDAVMEEEIFGPILPVVTYNAYDTEKSIAQNDFSGEVFGTQAAAGDFVDWAIGCVEEHPHPLALYFFSEDKKAQRRILDHCIFGWSILLQIHSHIFRVWSFSLQGANSASCSSLQFSFGLCSRT